MQDFGLVSIITPSYNSSRFISEMIESVITQTYTNWELLITDDCSTDNSVDIVKEYARKDSRIKLLCLEDNSGAGVARNNSINVAKGKFIAFLDSDDKWMPTKLEKQLFFMMKKNASLSYTSYLICNEENKIRGIIVPPKKQTFWNCKCDNKIGFSTAIYDVGKLGKVYMPNIRKRQDWGLHLTILKMCNVAYGMKEPLGYYRIGQDSLSKKKKSLIKYQILVYKKVLGWSTCRALIFFVIIFIPFHFIKKLEMKYISR